MAKDYTDAGPREVDEPLETVRTGYDALRDAADIDALYGVVICSCGPQCECPACRCGDPDDFEPTEEYKESERLFWERFESEQEWLNNTDSRWERDND